MLNFTANAQDPIETAFTDSTGRNLIMIGSSTFYNTGFHQNNQALSLDSDEFAESDEAFVDGVQFL